MADREDPGVRGFNFKLSFGRAPEATDLPGESQAADESVRELNVTLKDGRLLVSDSGDGVPDPPPKRSAEAEAWERLARIGTGAYPDTARMHSVLRLIVTLLGLGVPVALCVLGIASGQSTETVFYMTLAGLIFGVMLIKTTPG